MTAIAAATSDWQVLMACLAAPWSSAFQLAAHSRTTLADTHGALARFSATGLIQHITQRLPHLPRDLYAPTEQAVDVVAERWGCDEGVVAWRARMSERRFWWLRAALDIAQEVNGLSARLAHARPEWRVTWETGIVRMHHNRTLMLHGRLAISPESSSSSSPYYLLIDRGTQSPLSHWRVLRYMALGSRRFAKDAALGFPPLLIVTTTSFRAIALMRLAQRLNFLAPLAATWDRATLLQHGAHVTEWATLIRTEQSRVVLSSASPFAVGLLRAAAPKHLPHVLRPPAKSRAVKRAVTDGSPRAGERAQTCAIAVPTLSRLPAWGSCLEQIESLDAPALRVLACVCQHPLCSTALVAAFATDTELGATGSAVGSAVGVDSTHAASTTLERLRDVRLVTEVELKLPVSTESLMRLATSMRRGRDSDDPSKYISLGRAGEHRSARGSNVGRKSKGKAVALSMTDVVTHLERITATVTATAQRIYPEGSLEHSLVRAFRSGVRPESIFNDPEKSGGIKRREGREVWVMRLSGVWRATPEAIMLYALRAGMVSEEALRRYTAMALDRIRRPYHALAVDQFFTRLKRDGQRAAGATRPITWSQPSQDTKIQTPYYAVGDYIDEGLARASFRHGPSSKRYSWRPDGYGTVRCGEQITRFWLEVDGTAHTRPRLDVGSWRDKAEALCAYFASDAWTRVHETFPMWLIVTASLKSEPAIRVALHEASATFDIAVPAVYIASDTALLQRGPFAAIWIALHEDALGVRFGVTSRPTFTYAFGGARQPQIVTTAGRRDLLKDIERADALGLIEALGAHGST